MKIEKSFPVTSETFQKDLLKFIPNLSKISKKYPKNWDTQLEVHLGTNFGKRWIFYWASNKASSFVIKNFSEAYNSDYSNSGIIQVSKKGDAIFRVLCPQPYKVNNHTFFPHIHFVVSDDKNEQWDRKIRTVNVICDLETKKIREAIKQKSYLIIDALPKEYYEDKHIPNAINLYYRDADYMSDKDLEIFIRKNLRNLNQEIQGLVKDGKLDIKDIPIIIYCYNKNCRASKYLALRFLEAKFHKIYEYSKGLEGYFEKK